MTVWQSLNSNEEELKMREVLGAIELPQLNGIHQRFSCVAVSCNH